MKRRDAIKSASLLLGYTVAVGTSAAILNGCKAEPKINYVPEFLDMNQLKTVMHLAERIIPQTDTPGAIAAGIHTFIDQTVSRFWEKEDQDKMIAGLNAFSEKVKTDHGKDFYQLEPKVQDEIVSGIAKEEGDETLFKAMRELTVSGFFTSEVGVTEVLNYNPVPGPYQGCVDYVAGTVLDSTHGGGW